MFVVAAGAFAWSAHAASIIPGDARRGEQLFDTEQCIQCHSVKGRGGDIAPDLARRVDRNYTPTVMASLMWNHAPDMWAAMKKHGISQAHMTPESAADLFAYFVSARYFERRAMRGAASRLSPPSTARNATASPLRTRPARRP